MLGISGCVRILPARISRSRVLLEIPSSAAASPREKASLGMGEFLQLTGDSGGFNRTVAPRPQVHRAHYFDAVLIGGRSAFDCWRLDLDERVRSPSPLGGSGKFRPHAGASGLGLGILLPRRHRHLAGRLHVRIRFRCSYPPRKRIRHLVPVADDVQMRRLPRHKALNDALN